MYLLLECNTVLRLFPARAPRPPTGPAFRIAAPSSREATAQRLSDSVTAKRAAKRAAIHSALVQSAVGPGAAALARARGHTPVFGGSGGGGVAGSPFGVGSSASASGGTPQLAQRIASMSPAAQAMLHKRHGGGPHAGTGLRAGGAGGDSQLRAFYSGGGATPKGASIPPLMTPRQAGSVGTTPARSLSSSSSAAAITAIAAGLLANATAQSNGAEATLSRRKQTHSSLTDDLL